MAVQHDKVVILLATFNGARFLDNQLASFARQQHARWELLASDDGSQDRTLAALAAFRDQVPQTVAIVAGPGAGFWRNFQSMLHRDSDGDFFAFSDQDDVWLPGKLARALGALNAVDPAKPALYFTRTRLIDEDDVVTGLSPLFARRPSFRNALVQNIGGGNTMVLNRAARDLLKQAPQEIEIVSHDWWAYQIVTGAGGVAIYDPEPSVLYRQHARNIVGSNRGLGARWQRLRGLMAGRIVSWNDVNAAALDQVRHLLSPENRVTLDRFLRARRAPAWLKPFYLAQAGVHRQNIVETIGLYAGALLNRI